MIVTKEVSDVQDQLRKLAQRYFELVNPTREECQIAFEGLVDDPVNDIVDIVDTDTVTGMILVCDEVICRREMEEEVDDGRTM